jgi:hypothetical protein
VTDKSGHNAAGFRKLQKSESRHNAAGFRKLQKSGFSWLFLRLFVIFFTFCDYFLLFVTASFYITKTVTM